MKITAVILLAACLSAAATGKAQKVSLTLRDAPLEKALKEIKRQTGLDLLYTVDVLQHARPVTIELRNADLRQALDQCFQDQPLTYTIVENVIVVKLRPVTSAEGVGEEIVAAPIDVKGRVVDTAGNPVAGASVTVKGNRTKGTTTDENGYFELKGVDENATLVISGVNIEGLEVIVNSKTNLSELIVKMKVGTLDETIVQAYGTTTRRFNVGSISKVSAEEIERQPVSNPLAALQGRVPGLSISQTSGIPGAAIKIQIRGQNSLNPDPANQLIAPLNSPLFIVDGVPLVSQNTNLNQLTSIASPGNIPILNNPYGGISPFNSINPRDIESIEVLRDADATAIYGSRGANGVILITTKKGKIGKTRANFSFYSGASQVVKTMPMMNTKEYLQMRREAFDNDGIMPDNFPGSLGYAPDLLVFDTTKYTNWKNKFIGNTANTTDLNASIGGGSDNTQFLVGAGYRREEFIFPGDFTSNMASVNLNLSHRSTNNKFSLVFSTNYSYNNNNSSGAPELLSAFVLEPNFPDLTDANGNLVWDYGGTSLGDGYNAENPLAYLRRRYYVHSYNLISNFRLNYTLLPGLTIRSSFGYNTLNSDEYSANPKSSYNPSLNTVQSSANFGSSDSRAWIIEPQVEYIKKAGPGRLNVLLGTTFQENQYSSTRISASGYQNELLMESVSAAPNKFITDGHSQYTYNAVFGRINYVIGNKYILNLTGRRDGSSRFGPDKQFGNFGSVGVGWIFTEEPFLKRKNEVFSYGKFRFSYGTTGSDGIGDYQYIPRWAPTNYTYQGSLGFIPQNLYNPDFSWAITKKFEAGLDLGFYNDRILGSLTWFRNRSGNQLISYPLPSQTGFPNVVQNWSALVQNSGIEIQVSANLIRNSHFNWTTVFNMTLPKNKLISFPGLESSPYKNLYLVGQPLSVLYNFHSLGVNDTTGIFQFEAMDKQATYTPIDFDDYRINGNLDPTFFGGWGNSLSYRGFSLDLFFEFRKQTGVNFLQQVYGIVPGTKYNQPAILSNRWQKPGDHSDYQMFTTTPFSNAGIAANYLLRSDAIFSDASFIRMKNVSLAYNFSSSLLGILRLQSARVFFSGQNLLTISNYKGNDPETQNFYGVPTLRTIVAGLQLTF